MRIRKGYGKILLDYSLEKAKALGYGAVCFEGNIDFYGKSGFDYASKFGIKYAGFTNEMETLQTAESRAKNVHNFLPRKSLNFQDN